ncbi:putative porin [Marinimicrobium sp. C6131]|uniref:putative porin n=1 Tax=Marinimicrobium sp. C6131 TaxID=3022676 RepID=UPI00223DC044|nr:putative porin [Marinimicrobium sp. C6131]UZJ43487.1 putative porin [Marinimicrobium sp. C6131]
MIKRTSKITRCILPAALLLPTVGALADEYQWELSGHYSQIDTSTTDIDNVSVSGTYYFSPVETRDHPLAEAAFLERESNLSVRHSRIDRSSQDQEIVDDFGSYTILGTDATTDRTDISAEFYVPGDLFYVGLTARRFDYDSDSPFSSDTTWNASLGLTPVEGLLVYSTFYEDQELDENWNLNAKYVFDHFGPSLAVQANYDYDDFAQDSLALAVDYYIDRTLSVGYQRSEGVGSGPKLIDGNQLRIRKFFTDRWSLSGFYQDLGELDGFGVEATVRF